MKIFIKKPFLLTDVDNAEIFVIDDRNGKRAGISYDSVSGLLVRQELEEGSHEVVKPFIKLPGGMFDELVKAILEYTSQEGIKSPNENLLLGKMEAAEEHLKDMRRIVFKDFKAK